MIDIRKKPLAAPLAIVLNLLMVYAAYALCRFVYLVENWSTLRGGWRVEQFEDLIRGGFLFDTSAILYTNAPYILMMLIPLHYRESDAWQRAARWVYVLPNSLAVCMNLADSVYFQYTGRRTTVTVFSEFASENNIGRVILLEAMEHWYLFLIAAGMTAFFWIFCFMPLGRQHRLTARPRTRRRLAAWYAIQTAVLAAAVPLCVIGMRGGATTAVRPITISNANQYADSPLKAAVVLNTPFALIRTIDKPVFTVPDYMPAGQMNRIYNPLHNPTDTAALLRKNVVVLIVESFGREYIGALNSTLEGGRYRGYTPFVDSLLQHSATWQYTYSNGRKSIDGMPSILSSIPMFVEPFFLTPSSMNNVGGLAYELRSENYRTAFFHGAQNGSMGFQAFARATGFMQYYGRSEFNSDPRYGGDKEFDGTWAIWDEPFLQFFAMKMNEIRQPFLSVVFTASSHHPYNIPEQYKDTFPEGPLAIHKCIRYTDRSLRRFFETARRQPWYGNTLFVITADHTNLTDHAYYQTSLGGFSVPIIFFDPSGRLKPGVRPGIAQQIDIMPTVLSYLGHKRRYMAFGKDLLGTPADSTWAVNYLNGIYQYASGNYLLQFDGTRTTGLYRFKTDSLLKHNLAGKHREQARMEQSVKAIIQQYMMRMTGNMLRLSEKEAEPVKRPYIPYSEKYEHPVR